MGARPLRPDGGPPFHHRCVHGLAPFAERLGTGEEKSPTRQSPDSVGVASGRRYGDGAKRGVVSPDLLNKSPAELQRRFRKEFPDIARQVCGAVTGAKRPFARPEG